jgi:hypothetical protein
VTDAAGDDELVLQALDGLFDIASDERPASVQANLREQIAEAGNAGGEPHEPVLST